MASQSVRPPENGFITSRASGGGAKKLINCCPPSKTARIFLLFQIVGGFANHCRLNKHIHRECLAEYCLCKFCQEETALHVLCRCTGRAWLRTKIQASIFFKNSHLCPRLLSDSWTQSLPKIIDRKRVSNEILVINH